MDPRTWCLVCICAVAAHARGWSWPDQQQAGSEALRIDTKVRFLDTGAGAGDRSDKKRRGSEVQSDEPFHQPSDTSGFYNRPPDAGRFPVRVVSGGPAHEAYRVNGHGVFRVQNEQNDGTLDSVNFCKCISTPDCNPRQDSAEVCGVGKYLCCYKRPSKTQNIEVFNEIDDERPMLSPGRENFVGLFPAPPHLAAGGVGSSGQRGVLVGPGGPTGERGVLVGPGGPTGERGVLVGPGGPTGVVGPNGNFNSRDHRQQTPVLVGPDGPTGNIGPAPGDHDGRIGIIGPAPVGQKITADASAQRGVLVGPGGPTGIIGPYNQRRLVGPRGPTGVVPGRGGSRGVLVGPGGPTGIIGPGFGRQSGPGLLVGPGGPTGTIGPGRQLLVGPGGPTGYIGPRGYYGN